MKQRVHRVELDAQGQPIGRLASRIAQLLMGKADLASRPNAPRIPFVVVRHCRGVKVAKRKLTLKRYYRSSGYPGGLRSETLGSVLERHPAEAVLRAVRGMLPRNRLLAKRLQHLELRNE